MIEKVYFAQKSPRYVYDKATNIWYVVENHGTMLSDYRTNLHIVIKISSRTQCTLVYNSARKDTSICQSFYHSDPTDAEVDISDINNFLEKIDAEDPVIREMTYKLVRKKLEEKLKNDRKGTKGKSTKGKV